MAIVTRNSTVGQDDGQITLRVQVMMFLSIQKEATASRNIEAEVNFVHMHVEEDGEVVVVVTTDSKADQVDGMVPVMADSIVAVTEVDIVEEEKNFAEGHTVVVKMKAIEVVEEVTVAEGEVVTSCDEKAIT